MKRERFKQAYAEAMRLLPEGKRNYQIKLNSRKGFAFSTKERLIKIKFDLVDDPQVRNYNGRVVGILVGKIELRFFPSYDGIDLSYHKTDNPDYLPPLK